MTFHLFSTFRSNELHSLCFTHYKILHKLWTSDPWRMKNALHIFYWINLFVYWTCSFQDVLLFSPRIIFTFSQFNLIENNSWMDSHTQEELICPSVPPKIFFAFRLKKELFWISDEEGFSLLSTFPFFDERCGERYPLDSAARARGPAAGCPKKTIADSS